MAISQYQKSLYEGLDNHKRGVWGQERARGLGRLTHFLLLPLVDHNFHMAKQTDKQISKPNHTNQNIWQVSCRNHDACLISLSQNFS